MKKYILLISCSCIKIAIAQTSLTTLQVGDTRIQLQKQLVVPVSEGIYFINLHSSETTSIEATKKFISQPKQGGTFIQLIHQPKERFVFFKIRQLESRIDPNRIFTQSGRSITLKTNPTIRDTALKTAKILANFIINSMPKPQLIIGMHNNTNNNYSILNYENTKDSIDAADVYYDSSIMDVDNFVYTTELKIFNHFKSKKINVILQKSKGYRDDGSLSVYCGNNKIPYVNIEVEGEENEDITKQRIHLAIQLQMLDALKEVIDWYKTK